MTQKRRSIRDIPQAKRPKARVTITQYTDCCQAAILTPGMWEALILRKPTLRGCENYTVHELKKLGYINWVTWTYLEQDTPAPII